jgi:CHAD domain-containing protein
VTPKKQPRRIPCNIPIRDYAAGQTSMLLRRLAFQANRTAKLADVDAIHDLRVAIRRLTQCLRVFSKFFPRERTKKIQQKLEAVMDLASEVRNRDTALQLMAGAPPLLDSTLVEVLSHERGKAERSLVTALQRWNRRSFHKRSRSRLGL